MEKELYVACELSFSTTNTVDAEDNTLKIALNKIRIQPEVTASTSSWTSRPKTKTEKYPIQE